MNMRPRWDKIRKGFWEQMGWTSAIAFIAIVLFFVSGTYKIVWDSYIFVTKDLPAFREQMDAFDGMQRSLARIETELSSVSGTAKCIECCTGDRNRWLQVNRNLGASRFRDGQRVRVTRQTPPYTSLVVTVDGDFQPISNEMVQLNALTCGQMRLHEEEEEFRVTIIPAVEE